MLFRVKLPRLKIFATSIRHFNTLLKYKWPQTNSMLPVITAMLSIVAVILQLKPDYSKVLIYNHYA